MKDLLVWALRTAAIGAMTLAAIALVGCGRAECPERPAVLDEIRSLIDEDEKFAEAAARCRRLLPDFEEEYGAASCQVAWLIDLWVESLWRDVHGGEDETLRLALRAVEIKEGTLGRKRVDTTKSLVNLAEVHSQRGEDDEAERLFREAVATCETILPPGERDLWFARMYLAAFHDGRDRWDVALAQYEQALAGIREPTGPEDTRPLFDRVFTLNSIARIHRHREAYAESRRIFGEVLETRRTLGEEAAVAWTLNSLALLEDTLGLYEDALEHHEEALEIRTRGDADEETDLVATVRQNLALTHRAMGNYDQALAELDRALDAWARLRSERDIAQAKQNKARALHLMGDLPAAEILFEQALEGYERLGIDRTRAVASTLEYFASLLLELGECDRARDRMRRAIRIAEEKFDPEMAEYARYPRTLARIEEACGDPSAALGLLETALETQRAVYGDKHPWTAETRWSLARHHSRSGALGEALRAQRQVVASFTEFLGEDHPLLLQARVEEAELTACAGETDRASGQVLDVERDIRSHLQSAIQSLPGRQALRYAGTLAAGLDLTVALAAETRPREADVSRAWDSLIRSRALILEELTRRARRGRGAASAGQGRLEGRFDDAVRRLVEALVRGPGDLDPEGYRGLVDALILEKESLEREVARAARGPSAAPREGVPGYAEVAGAIGPDTALVAYVKYGRMACLPSEGSRDARDSSRPLASEPHYAAFVLPAGAESPLRHLGPAGPIEALARDWIRAAGKTPPTDRSSAARAEHALRAIGGELKRAVWDPVASAYGQPRVVIVVAAADLHLINFDALPLSSGEYLIERGPLIQYVSTERDLLRPGSDPTAERKLLAIGGPDFDLELPSGGGGPPASPATSSPPMVLFRGDCPAFGKLGFDHLPNAAKEAKDVAGLWNRTHDEVDPQPEPAGTLTGRDATEAAMRAAAPGTSVLHLATHGFFLEGDCLSVVDSAVGANRIRGITSLGPRQLRVEPRLLGDSPLLLSGLALAGANRRGDLEPGQDDGILYAAEIATLDLERLEMAVLSACDTGRGRIVKGEGVFGLRRAFEIAGARSVVMSLWKVEDRATRDWMRQLYEARYVTGLGLAGAIRAASLESLRRERSERGSGHPNRWAPFVGVGGSDWRRLP